MADRNRLPRWRRADLDDAQQALYDVFVTGPRQSQSSFFPVADADGVLSGPYRAMLLSPALGRTLERVGRAVRYESTLPDRTREVAILTVAQLTESDVEWAAHEGMARAAGVPPDTVETLRAGRPEFTDDQDALVYRFTEQLLVAHEVADETFADVQATHGSSGVFELVATIGYYQFIAHLNNAFGLAPAGAPVVASGDQP